MLYSLKLELSLDEAEIIARSLEPDDTEWARSGFREGKLVIEIETPKMGALVNAVDDFFMNVKPVISALNGLKQD